MADERGPTGARGPTGDRGRAGAHGVTGEKGPVGERGPAAEYAVLTERVDRALRWLGRAVILLGVGLTLALAGQFVSLRQNADRVDDIASAQNELTLLVATVDSLRIDLAMGVRSANVESCEAGNGVRATLRADVRRNRRELALFVRESPGFLTPKQVQRALRVSRARERNLGPRDCSSIGEQIPVDPSAPTRP